MLPDPVPVDETPTDNAPPAMATTTGAPAPAIGAPLGLVWWAIVGITALLAVVGGATALALQPPGPASVPKLADLLVDPAGRTTRMSMSIDPETGDKLVVFGATGPGDRWTVTRAWRSSGTSPDSNSGWLNLTQYQTEDQARVGFTLAATGVTAGQRHARGRPRSSRRLFRGRPAGPGRVNRAARGRRRQEGHDRDLGLEHNRYGGLAAAHHHRPARPAALMLTEAWPSAKRCSPGHTRERHRLLVRKVVAKAVTAEGDELW